MPGRYCRSVTEPTRSRDQPARQPLHEAGGPGRYLPSAQVVEELASLGPDLVSLPDELRRCLSETAEDLTPRPRASSE